MNYLVSNSEYYCQISFIKDFLLSIPKNDIILTLKFLFARNAVYFFENKIMSFKK